MFAYGLRYSNRGRGMSDCVLKGYGGVNSTRLKVTNNKIHAARIPTYS